MKGGIKHNGKESQGREEEGRQEALGLARNKKKGATVAPFFISISSLESLSPSLQPLLSPTDHLLAIPDADARDDVVLPDPVDHVHAVDDTPDDRVLGVEVRLR